jgi:hypothetical protein
MRAGPVAIFVVLTIGLLAVALAIEIAAKLAGSAWQ